MYYSGKVTVLLIAEPEHPVLFYLVKTKAYRKISPLYYSLLNPCVLRHSLRILSNDSSAARPETKTPFKISFSLFSFSII